MTTSNYSIVCVDDDNDILEILTELVEVNGYKCVPFDNVDDAVKYIDQIYELYKYTGLKVERFYIELFFNNYFLFVIFYINPNRELSF